MRIRHDCIDGVRIVYLRGHLAGDMKEEGLQRALHRVIRPKNARLVVDLGEVTFISVLVVDVFVRAHLKLRSFGGRLVFCRANEYVGNLMVTMTDLEFPFELVPAFEEAKALLLAPPEPVPIVEA